MAEVARKLLRESCVLIRGIVIMRVNLAREIRARLLLIGPRAYCADHENGLAGNLRGIAGWLCRLGFATTKAHRRDCDRVPAQLACGRHRRAPG